MINRLKLFIDHKGISLNAFDKSINAGNGYTGRQIKNQASIGSDILEKIFSTYPDLNINWLFTGNGSMTLDDGELVEEPVSESNFDILKYLKEKDETIRLLNVEIGKLQKELELKKAK